MSLDIEDQYDKIYKYCYFRTKNKQLAEDLTQETFLKFFNQNSYISRGKPLAYLYTIAKNLCIDTYNKKQTEPLKENIVSEDIFNKVDTNFAVTHAVKSLPNNMQEIILLRFANELSMSEISGITGLSRFAIYRIINNAIKLLKTQLREEDFLE